MNKFSDIINDTSICKAISAMGFSAPTPVQLKVIPEVLMGKDIIVSAQTGTGKTAAYLLPILQKLTQYSKDKTTRVLVLAPTRELAEQISLNTKQFAKFLPVSITSTSLVGGLSYSKQMKDLDRGANIIIATPGRLIDYLKQKKVDLSQVEVLVLDEADRMLDMGFVDDVTFIAKQIRAKRQTLLLSATMDNRLSTLIKKLLHDPVFINLSLKNVTATQIEQQMYQVSHPRKKMQLLTRLLDEENIYKAIIFSATKIGADRIADELKDKNYTTNALHGDLRQNVRNRVLASFKNGKINVLVATDVAARGIDVDDISHVINYDLPKFYEDYVHRIGRTGRAGKSGKSISFVLPNEIKQLRAIERFVGKKYTLLKDKFSDDKDERSDDEFTERHSFSRKKPSSKRNFKHKTKSFETSRPKRSESSSRSYDQEHDSRKSDSPSKTYGKKYARKFDSSSKPYGQRHEAKRSESSSRSYDQEHESRKSDSSPRTYGKKHARKFDSSSRSHDQEHESRKSDSSPRSYGKKHARKFDSSSKPYGQNHEAKRADSSSRSYDQEHESRKSDSPSRSYGKKRESNESRKSESSSKPYGYGQKQRKYNGNRTSRSKNP